MSTLSKDIKKKSDAVAAVAGIATPDEVIAFVLGDERPDVIAAAEVRLQELAAAVGGTKQGEQAGSLTRETQDFKTGIQRAKSASESVTGSDIVERIDEEDEARADATKPASQIVRGQDVIAAIDEADERKASALERKALDDAAALKAGKKGPEVVTGEMVVKAMRARGERI